MFIMKGQRSTPYKEKKWNMLSACYPPNNKRYTVIRTSIVCQEENNNPFFFFFPFLGITGKFYLIRDILNKVRSLILHAQTASQLISRLSELAYTFSAPPVSLSFPECWNCSVQAWDGEPADWEIAVYQFSFMVFLGMLQSLFTLKFFWCALKSSIFKLNSIGSRIGLEFRIKQ